jgi:hypothetical protein
MTAAPFTTRRRFLVGAAASFVAAPAWAGEFIYRDFHFHPTGAADPISGPLAASLRAQVDLVESLRINPAIKAFFRSQPIEIDPTTPGGPGDYDFVAHRLHLSVAIVPPDNPILLHELLHAFHDLRLSGGRGNATVLEFYRRAQVVRAFPAASYVMKNPVEFFAMCAAAVLWGREARPPYTRANLRAHMPRFHDWIVATFSLVE